MYLCSKPEICCDQMHLFRHGSVLNFGTPPSPSLPAFHPHLCFFSLQAPPFPIPFSAIELKHTISMSLRSFFLKKRKKNSYFNGERAFSALLKDIKINRSCKGQYIIFLLCISSLHDECFLSFHLYLKMSVSLYVCYTNKKGHE